MDIKKMGLEELSASECKKANGGVWWMWPISAVLSTMFIDLITDPSGCAYEFNRGWNGGK